MSDDPITFEFKRFLRDVKDGCAKPERTALLDSAIERAEMLLGPGLPESEPDAEPGFLVGADPLMRRYWNRIRRRRSDRGASR